MSDYLKSYRVCIKTHSPLYIGSGLEYTKKEYVIQGGTVGIVNLQKLSVLIYKKGLFESYSNFMTGSNKDLYGWLIQSRFTKEEIDSVTDYSFSGNNVNLDKQHGIKSCIKDAFNKPYIPGSSIKGYIRTALLAYEIQNHPDVFYKFKEFPNSREVDNYKKELKKTITSIENAAFEIPIDNKNSKSKMSGIIISDSKPVDTENLVLCEKIDLFPNGKHRSPNIYYEAIRPDTKIWFTLTIDETKCSYTKEVIMNSIKLFASQYSEFFLSKFDKITPFKYTNTIWLGGNTGYPTKTIAYNLLGRNKGLDEVSEIMEFMSRGKHTSDMDMGVSPHCLNATKYNNQLCHMGECTLAFAKTDK